MTPVQRLINLTAAALLLIPYSANADFYRYIGKDGVEVYSNMPTEQDAVRVLREREEKPTPGTRKSAKVPAKSKAPRSAALAEPEAKQPASAQQQVLPVSGGVVTSGYGWRKDPIDGGVRHHNGVDIAVPSGSSVRCITGGRVIESGWHGGYGNLVTIDHGDGMISMYGHNSRLCVKVGDQVEAGETIAFSGSTGRSTGPHLHFELWKNGSNLTEAYLRNGDGGHGMPQVATRIRTFVDSKGTIVFTNQ
jgi:murein DD-endopeptidase MepM/ murein hydrolase activator NlpD